MSVIIGKGRSAEVFLVSHPIYGPVAVKRYKYKKNDDHERKFIRIHNEVKILHKLTKLADICPNFCGILETNIKSSDIYNPRCNYILTRKPYIIMPLFDITLHKFQLNYHAKKIYKSILFQTCIALICLQKYINTRHGDIHQGNIGIKYINKDTVINYIINGRNYAVKTYGYQVILSDFGAGDLNTPNSDGDLKRLSMFWRDIIYYYYLSNFDLKTDVKVKEALAKLRKIDIDDIKQKWDWYDKTNGKGIVDYKLFVHLIENAALCGFDYMSSLSDKYASLIKYLINLLEDININRHVINYSDFRLCHFGMSETLSKKEEHNYVINYS